MPDVRPIRSISGPALARASAALLAMTTLAGCLQGQGGSDSMSQDAPIVAAQRENTATGSFKRAFGDSSDSATNGAPDSVAGGQLPDDAPPSVPAKDAASGGDQNTPSPGTGSDAVAGAPERPTLHWNAPLTRENGSALYLSEIGGYKVYYRLRHEEAFNSMRLDGADSTQLPLDDFDSGAYEFSISVLDSDGLESRKSDPLSIDLI